MTTIEIEYAKSSVHTENERRTLLIESLSDHNISTYSFYHHKNNDRRYDGFDTENWIRYGLRVNYNHRGYHTEVIVPRDLYGIRGSSSKIQITNTNYINSDIIKTVINCINDVFRTDFDIENVNSIARAIYERNREHENQLQLVDKHYQSILGVQVNAFQEMQKTQEATFQEIQKNQKANLQDVKNYEINQLTTFNKQMDELATQYQQAIHDLKSNYEALEREKQEALNALEQKFAAKEKRLEDKYETLETSYREFSNRRVNEARENFERNQQRLQLEIDNERERLEKRLEILRVDYERKNEELTQRAIELDAIDSKSARRNIRKDIKDAG